MLITLTIIGVVAALTIPNLMQKYTEQTTVKKLQKFYSNLSNAYSLAVKENGYEDEWNLTGTVNEKTEKIYNILFKPYFKIAKNCGINNTGNCISNDNYAYLNNQTYQSFGLNNYYYKITLEDGAAIWWRSQEGDANTTTNKARVVIFYDTNGIKKPNQSAADLFNFNIYNKKIYPVGTPRYDGTTNFRTYCNKSNTGGYCTGWVIYKGNMDYLHCDDLSWTGKDKCK